MLSKYFINIHNQIKFPCSFSEESLSCVGGRCCVDCAYMFDIDYCNIKSVYSDWEKIGHEFNQHQGFFKPYSGCVLPKEKRPSICLVYTCAKIEGAMDIENKTSLIYLRGLIEIMTKQPLPLPPVHME